MTSTDQQILDPTPEIDLETVKKRSVTGVIALTGRYFVLYAMALVAQIFLGVYLSPSEWGVFALASALVDFLVYFSDIGLAASLIQSEKEIDDDDLKTTFTIQQVLVISLLVVFVLLSGKIRTTFSLSEGAMTLLYAMSISLFLSSLRTIPTVLLERKIRFHKIAFVNVLEHGVYYLVLVIAAGRGLGINSFTYAILSRAVLGVILMYRISPWRPIVGVSRKSLTRLLSFGVPYQANTLLALAKDRGVTILVGKILGLEALGFLDWAQKWSQMPLRVVLDSVTKVTFPAFSRMQSNKLHLASSTTRSIFFITFLAFPSIVGLVLLSPIIVNVIPQYQKWTPALIPLALMGVNAMFASFTTQLTNLMSAIGRIKFTFYLMIMWTILTVVFVPLLSTRFGINGAALGYALVGSSSLVALYVAKKFVNFSVSDSILKPLYGAIAMAVVLMALRSILPANLFTLSILIIVGMLVYSTVIIGIVGANIIADAKRGLKTLFSK